MQVVELFRRKKHVENNEFDPYEDVFGVKMDVESLLYMRDLEDFWIELGHITEEERYPVPDYLREEWVRVVGVDEGNRARHAD